MFRLEGRPASDSMGATGACCNLFGKLDNAEWCVKEYFLTTQSKDELFCRAYLCQSQLIIPTTCKDLKIFELSVGCLLTAIQNAKVHESLKYLVYNASVLHWSFCRPFMRNGYRHLIVDSLQFIISSLNEINDTDFEWRSDLLILLSECIAEVGLLEELVSIGMSTLQFIKQHQLNNSKDVLQILFNSVADQSNLNGGILDLTKIIDFISYSQELTIYWKLLCIKRSSDMVLKYEEIKNMHVCLTSYLESKHGSQTGEPFIFKSCDGLTKFQRAELFTDLTRLSIEASYQDISEKCLEELSKLASIGLVDHLNLKILKIEHKRNMANGNIYSKSSIKLRLDVIEELVEYITSAFRRNEESLIQVGCVTLWNTCLPLLQNNLRHHILKPLKIAAKKLEEIDSLLVLMRIQMHIELAKLESDQLLKEASMSQLLKASVLDVEGIYENQIEHLKQKLNVSMFLYQQPVSLEDQAASIIEKAASINIKNHSRIGAYLKKAGCLLSSDVFNIAIEGEKALTNSERSSPKILFEKIEKYKQGIKAVDDHFQKISANDSDFISIKRTYLWSDLVKIARKQGLLDITRVSSIFFFYYYNKIINDVKEGLHDVKPKHSHDAKHCELNRLASEIHFIYAECLVQLLKYEGAELLQIPTSPKYGRVEPQQVPPDQIKEEIVRDPAKLVNPTSISTTPGGENKTCMAARCDADPQWSCYCKWLMEVSETAIQHFVHSADIGVQLKEDWIVNNASVYILNYTSHLISKGQFSLLTKYLKPFYVAMQSIAKTGKLNQTILCKIGNALVQGLIQSFIATAKDSAKNDEKIANIKKKKSPTKTKKSALTEVKDEITELTEANSILEYILKLTTQHIIPLASRIDLLKSWMLCKGLMNQSKNYLSFQKVEDAEVVFCHLEVLVLNKKKVANYSPTISVNEVIDLAKSMMCKDILISLEIWVKLAHQSFINGNMEKAIECCNCALDLKTPQSKTQKLKNEKIFMKSFQLLYYANLIKGQCYTSTINKWVDTFNYALPCFVEACIHAKNGSFTSLVLIASKHYWNAIQPFLYSTAKLKKLQSSLKALLDVIAFLLNKNKDMVKPLQYLGKGNKFVINDEESELIVSLHDVLFRSYSEQKQFEEGVKAIEDLSKVIKFSQHPTLLKHKVIFLVRLKKSIESDMAKFCKPNDKFLSNIWLEIATSSVNCLDKLSAYKNSVCVLSNDNIYNKVCRLMDLASFLYSNNYPFEATMECLTHAMNFLLSKNLVIPSIGLSIPLDLNGNTVVSIEEMTALIYLLLMVAEISTTKSNMFIECVNSALFLVKLMWKSSYINVEKSIHIGYLPGEKLDQEKKELLFNTEISSISYCLTEDVSSYKLPEKHLQYYKADCNGLFISKNSIKRPMQFFFYMEKLVNYLEINCLTHLTADVLLLMAYVSEEILRNQILVTLVHLKCSILYDTLEIADAFCYHYNFALNTDIFSVNEQVQSQEELYLWKKNERSPSSTKSHLPDKIVFKVDYYIKIAELFIQLKSFSKAQYLLQEALTISRAIGYEEGSTLIEYHYAVVLYNRGDLFKAMTLLSNPGFSPADMWFKRAILVVDLSLDVSRTYCLSQNDSFCENTNFFMKSKLYLKNIEKIIQPMKSSLRVCDYEYMKACLAKKLGDLLCGESKDCLDEQKIKLLTEACFQYQESLGALKLLGFKNESFQLQVLLVKVLKEVVESKKQIKKDECLAFYHQGKSIFEDIRSCAISIGNFENLGSILPPIYRYLLSSYSSLTYIMKLVLAIATKENVQKFLLEENKSAIDQVIEKYVDLKPEVSQFEQLWHDAVQEIVVTSVNISHSLLVSCNKLSYQYVEILGDLGQLLSFISKVKTADSFSSFEMKEEKFRNILQNQYFLDYFISTTSQSMEYTMAAIYHGLEKGHIEVVKKASFHLLENIGNRDSYVALQLLALYQSCCFSLHMRKVLRYVFAETTQSSSAVAFNTNELSHKLYQEPPHGFINETNMKNLDKYEWWYRLTVLKNHFQFFKEIPFKLTYLILQHSPDYKYLFGGIFNSGISGKKKEGLPEIFTFLSRTETNHELLNSMLEMSEEFTNFNKEFLKKYPIKDASVATGVSLSEENSDKKKLLEEHQILFENLIAVIEAYCGDILTHLERFLGKEKEAVIVILADKDLLQLPLEAMSVFSNENIKSVTRDFSLQIMHHRFNPRVIINEKKTDSVKTVQDAVKTVQDGKQKPKSKSPNTIKDQKVTGTFRVDKENIVFDPTFLKYIVDPFADTDIVLTDINQTMKVDPNHPEVVFKEIISEKKQKTSKWVGIKGSEKASNVKEIQMLLNASFIFHGYGQFFSVVPPSYVASLNLSDCYLAMLFDLALTKRNTLVPFVADKCFSGDSEIENPVITSAILSLCGTASVLLNQWTTTLHANNKRLRVIVSGLLNCNITVGELIRSISLCKNVESTIENEIEISDNTFFENHERFNMVLYGLPNFLMGL